MGFPVGRTGTNGAHREGDIFQLTIQNGKVSQRGSGLPAWGGRGSPPGTGVEAGGWAGHWAGVMQRRLRL